MFEDIEFRIKKSLYVKDNFGRKIKKSNAALIENTYYNINKVNPPLVSFNLLTKKYELYNKETDTIYNKKSYITKYMLHYVNYKNEISVSPDNNALKKLIGKSKYNSLIPGFDYSDQTSFLFENEEAAKTLGFEECFEAGIFVKGKKANKKVDDKVYIELFNSKTFKKCANKKEAIDYGTFSSSFIGTGGVKYTFGVEIETSRGTIPQWVYNHHKLNMDATYDGSLKDPDGKLYGGEYVTGVLVGDAGLKNLFKCVKEINTRCAIDKRCGIHVHVGGFNNNEEFTVFSYILAKKIEKEIFTIFPPSRHGNQFAGTLPDHNFEEVIKNTNLKYGVSICYEKLFKELANGRELDSKLSKFRPHPGGRYTDRYSGNIPFEKLYRYKWLNFIPTNFNTRQASINEKELNKGIPFTLEFRPHSASMNYTKIKNWVLFCLAFVSYVENHQSKILNNPSITVKDILSTVYSNRISENLINYFEERKTKYKDPTSKIAVSNEINEYTELVNHSQKKIKEILNS